MMIDLFRPGARDEARGGARGAALGCCIILALLLAAPLPLARAQGEAEPAWRHGASLNGTPRHLEGFAHFDYVNPDAPKGGTVRLANASGFDSFNPVIRRGVVAPGIALIYDTLLTPALSEIDISTEYGLIAEAMRYPDDYSWVEFRLDPAARWHDGMPVTPDDVLFSFNAYTMHNPGLAAYYQNVVSAEAVGENIVRFEFDETGNRELPKILGALIILPRHWWEGTDANGEKRDISRSTLEPPLGSGPYRIDRFEANRTIAYARVDDYWARDHPTQRGKNNFDELRYEVFRDATVALEAFKADRYDFRSENISKNWATAYDIPAIDEGRIVRETFPATGTGVMQAFVMNLRRPEFADQRVRRALNLAFDFETTNRTVFYSLYKRTPSFFAPTALASSGMPDEAELAILESVRDLVPPSVFERPYENPVAGDTAALRANLRQAIILLREAGYELIDNVMTNVESGEPLAIEFVENTGTNAPRFVLPYAQNLARIGITLDLRIVDTPQYVNRIRERDFDMTMLLWGQSLSPGNEQRDFWGSQAAGLPASRNYAGISDEAVDRLIERLVYAAGRADLIAATRALDRVLLHNDFVIPLWHKDETFTARWNRFGRPEKLPEYTSGFPFIWWWDAQMAARTGGP